MSSAPTDIGSMTCGQLASEIQAGARRHLSTLITACALGLALLFAYDYPHTDALVWIVLGTLIPIIAWSRARNPGLPLIAVLALQTLAIFGVPILTQNESITSYPADEIFRAAIEVFVFCLALGGAWRLFNPPHKPIQKPRFFWAVPGLNMEKIEVFQNSALILLGLSCAFEFATCDRLLDTILASLPDGSYPVVRTIFDVTALTGCLAGGFAVADSRAHRSIRFCFWALLACYCLLKISTMLLSALGGVIVATFVGYLLGARRPPWLFLATVMSALTFLNIGKFEMRAKYWDIQGQAPIIAVADLPALYTEWAESSLNVISFNKSMTYRDKEKGQKLANRLNNLQNLLFVQDATSNRGVSLLYGETYTVIPVLLIPRIFWAKKPRTHEGQIRLNIHFGRQFMEETIGTYIAWGLLAEAYGNFGAVLGSLICGFGLGALVGGIERWIRPYPIFSLESFYFLIVTVNFSLSFEMVASVWITSVFQMFMTVTICLIPFAKRNQFAVDAPS